MLALVALVALDLASVRLPSIAALEQAVSKGDSVETERVARRLGAARLMRTAESGTARARLAALEALPLVDDLAPSLPRLVTLALRGDDKLVDAAARATRRAAERLTRERGVDEEWPPDVPRAAAQSIVNGLAQSTRASVRVELLRAAMALGTWAPLDDQVLVACARDASPLLRAAAIETCAAQPSLRAIVLAAIDDPDKQVAITAAVLACRAPLDDTARARVRELATATRDPALGSCLTSFATPEDRKLVKALRKK